MTFYYDDTLPFERAKCVWLKGALVRHIFF